MRRISVATGEVAERILIVRLDPSLFRFRVLYTPDNGQRVLEWATRKGDKEPLLVVNGGDFTPEYHATGLVVSGGQAYGVSYGDFAGMFAVLPGGRVEVRWLAAEPYDPNEMLLEAVQSFPMLVKPGGDVGFPLDPQDLPARRTVVAQDVEGQILFLIATEGYLTLHELSRWLAGSDLGIDVALNLDGGQSSGLFLAAGDTRVEVDSLVPVPVVIVAEERE
ncbi:MAG TPA: phosphodiester glycosidase family protein [Anaerolineae bacterium]|nr:phosphodiester glycosidase family protein [Anaerolineae bacterium]